MVAIPKEQKMTPQQAFTRLQEWFLQKKELAELKTKEILERKGLVGYFFPEPEEGTNRLDLGGGYDLILSNTITRSVDEAALADVKAAQVKKLKINLDTLFPTKPSLSVAEYRKLNKEQRAFVDTLLDIKEGSPGLDIKAQATEEVAARAVEHKTVAIAAKLATVPEITVVADPTTAKPGEYYSDGKNWWRLTDDYEWEDCVNPMGDAPVAPKKRAARKAAVKKK